MARLPRLTVAGYPQHVIQRGNNRQPIFLDDQDRQYMLALLGEYAPLMDVALHAYVLMDNHFHLLATPGTAEGLPKLMQAVGRRYVRHFNHRHGRTGTLWEGRYRSTVIETDRYLLTCMVYLDLNPVRAGLVSHARDYPWSSHAHCIGLRVDRLVTPHPLWWALGNTPFAREAAYAEMVHSGLSVAQQGELTDATLRGWVLGTDGFVTQLQAQTPRRVRPKRPGRPPKLSPSD
ncbi:MAG: transposase [Hydrogenophaga sp.]